MTQTPSTPQTTGRHDRVAKINGQFAAGLLTVPEFSRMIAEVVTNIPCTCLGCMIDPEPMCPDCGGCGVVWGRGGKPDTWADPCPICN